MVNKANLSFSLNCKQKLYAFEGPVVMGILNTTPDSFFDGGKYNVMHLALEHTAKLLSEGADFIDIGGASTRPDAEEVSIQEEMDRVLAIIEKLKLSFKDILISIDTYRSEVAEAALNAGAVIVNDISGGNMDQKMFDLIAKENCPYVLSHIQGTPSTMQKNPQYEEVVLEVLKDLSFKIAKLESLGVKDIIVDPGFGFGKTIEQNYQLLANLPLFVKSLKKPILVGLSRKSMLYKPMGLSPEDSLNVTTAAHVIALQNGASILRAHDVKAAKQAIAIWQLSSLNSK